VLVRLGVRAIPLGIAVVVGFAPKLPGTQAGPAEVGLPAPGISVFGTIHPDILRLPVPLGSAPPEQTVQLASLDPEIAGSGLADRLDKPSKPRSAASVCGDGRLDDAPASFDTRFSSIDDCPGSLAENLGSAMRERVISMQSPPNATVETAEPRAERLAYAAPTSAADVITDASAEPARADTIKVPEDDESRTAIYDISAHAVYLPSGRRLEAHSGVGEMQDNPRHVRVRMRGATPPNLYKLTLRGALFHGVRALRMTPLDESKMYGRDGILAHSYLMRAKGQSHGCVAFSDYPEFLNAFLRGEVTRISVVEHLDSPPAPKLAAGSLQRGKDSDRQLAGTDSADIPH
jgi:Protein of unknown function (DUF2778)